MGLHWARIVGYKKDKTRIGYAFPIFEYNGSYGVTSAYTRRESMERTPFTNKKNYLICNQCNRGQVFELGEYAESLTQMTTLFLFAVGAIGLLLFPIVGVAIFALLFSWKICAFFGRVRHECKNKIRIHQLPIMEGKIVGYQTEIFGVMSLSWYQHHPVIEYTYKGRIYRHVSNSCHSDIEDDSTCLVCVDKGRHCVYDSIETNLSTLRLIFKRYTMTPMINPTNPPPTTRDRIVYNPSDSSLRTHEYQRDKAS